MDSPEAWNANAINNKLYVTHYLIQYISENPDAQLIRNIARGFFNFTFGFWIKHTNIEFHYGMAYTWYPWEKTTTSTKILALDNSVDIDVNCGCYFQFMGLE